MEKRYNILGQRGTLLVEAIAMLGLIAIVTPTLYKKSAERMQEIQDINVASQARTMNSIVETFVKSNFDNLLNSASVEGNSTLVLVYDDNTEGEEVYPIGYSAYVPFGYTAGDLKNYGSPRVFVHRDGSTLVSYIVFPATSDPGQKRAARIASLVGANGGTASEPLNSSDTGSVLVYGTGGAWKLSQEMLADLGAYDPASPNTLPLNSLVVTAAEPITISNIDSEKFLYRVPPEGDGEDYHNTMVTDLYMGGASEPTSWTNNAEDYYSIWNVRKLTLNTVCTPGVVHSSGAVAGCDPNVADLYIGRPTISPFSGQSAWDDILNKGNTGAAWFYGNLSALKERFRLYRDGSSITTDDEFDVVRDSENYDVLEFSRRSDTGDSSDVGAVELSVLRAQNAGSGASVEMINGFVAARENPDATAGTMNGEFLVGNSSVAGGEGGLIRARYVGNSSGTGTNELSLNTPDAIMVPSGAFTTNINRRGGYVYIGGVGDSSSSGVLSEVYINDHGGTLSAGEDGNWMLATGGSSDANVHMLMKPGSSSVFTIGSSDVDSHFMAHMENERVALSNGRLLLYNVDSIGTEDSASFSPAVHAASLEALTGHSGENLVGTSSFTGTMVANNKYFDVLGSTLMGGNNMVNAPDSSEVLPAYRIYNRNDWRLTVSGSTYIDGLLWARNAWFVNSGFKELHAGYSSYSDYINNIDNGWLHATGSSVTMRNKLASGADKTMFEAKDSSIIMRDLNGASVHLEGGAKMEYSTSTGERNHFVAASEGESSYIEMMGHDTARIYTEDSSISGVVDIQQGGFRVFGHPNVVAGAGSSETYSSKIVAKTGNFGIKTTKPGSESRMQFQVNNQEIATRDVDFRIMDDDEGGEDIERTVFLVKPNSDNSSNANVQIRGTLHVNDNSILHISSNDLNRASSESGDDRHAMLEIDPHYIQVWSRNSSTGDYVGSSGSEGYYAMLRIDPDNLDGEAGTNPGDASIYIRKGAIELEQSMPSGVLGDPSEYSSDTGYGYIMANRFVSNAGQTVPTYSSATGAFDSGIQYDQYMVNPAYTSVMHDIKLTTRGGARLSDILPDYILKGVYNLINNYEEGDSSGDPSSQTEYMNSWADPYIGIIPFASCPPGYHQLATIVPISFNVGQAGDVIVEEINGNKRFRVNPAGRQARILAEANESTSSRIAYPTLEHVSSFVFNSMTGTWSSSSYIPEPDTQWRSEGWFMGFPAVHPTSDWSTTVSAVEGDSSTAWKYRGGDASSDSFRTVAEPLYFQQNTWLKTSVVPQTGDDARGWRAYMGFLYDSDAWTDVPGGISRENSIVSNANDSGSNESSVTEFYSGFVWNLFPVPTNTLEGHATVYCYFDRSNFREGEWGTLVDPIDQLGAIRGSSGVTFRKGRKREESPGYVERLNDPTLRYNDPW